MKESVRLFIVFQFVLINFFLNTTLHTFTDALVTLFWSTCETFVNEFSAVISVKLCMKISDILHVTTGGQSSVNNGKGDVEKPLEGRIKEFKPLVL